MTLPATYQAQLPNIQKSGKFEGGKPVPFPGYTVMTPPWQEALENGEFYDSLKSCQQELSEQLDPGLMVAVTPDSFHLTIADLIWDSDYLEAVADNPQFETQLRDRIAISFYHYQRLVGTASPIQLQLLGLTVFPRAIAVCLAPKDEGGYDRIVQLRRAIYQNPGIVALGIEQQYYFTAHITLGYFGEIAPDLDRDRLSSILSTLNDRWIEIDPPSLTIHQLELRKFDDMIHYYREPDWPVLTF